MLKRLLDMGQLHNGDWENPLETEIYLPHGTPYDERSLISAIASRMVHCFVPGIYKIISEGLVMC